MTNPQDQFPIDPPHLMTMAEYKSFLRDYSPCVLFLAARDEAPRRAFAEKHNNKETEVA